MLSSLPSFRISPIVVDTVPLPAADEDDGHGNGDRVEMMMMMMLMMMTALLLLAVSRPVSLLRMSTIKTDRSAVRCAKARIGMSSVEVQNSRCHPFMEFVHCTRPLQAFAVGVLLLPRAACGGLI